MLRQFSIDTNQCIEIESFFQTTTKGQSKPHCRIMHQGNQYSIQSADNSTYAATVRAAGLLLLVPCLLISVLLSFALAGDKIVIYFYSSETNVNNFKSLKMQFDQYLSEFGSFEFQPFSDRNTFEEQIAGKPRCLVLLSSWHYTNIYQKYHLHPLLVGSRKGEKYQRRVLVTDNKTNSIEAVQTGQIASSSSIQHTRSTLRQMFHNDELVNRLRVLTVPKDIDALMSLGFGMAKAALTTDGSLDKLQAMNPVLHKRLTILEESEESLLLILAAPEEFVPQAQELLLIFQEMAENADGQRKMRMLGLDDWQILDPTDTATLEN